MISTGCGWCWRAISPLVFSLVIVLFGSPECPDVWLGYAVLALNLIVGFEADSLRRWTLDRRAWRQIAVVTGRSSEECERRFFDTWLATVPAVSPAISRHPVHPEVSKRRSAVLCAKAGLRRGHAAETHRLAHRHAVAKLRAMSERVVIIDYGSGNLHSARKSVHACSRRCRNRR